MLYTIISVTRDGDQLVAHGYRTYGAAKELIDNRQELSTYPGATQYARHLVVGTRPDGATDVAIWYVMANGVLDQIGPKDGNTVAWFRGGERRERNEARRAKGLPPLGVGRGVDS